VLRQPTFGPLANYPKRVGTTMAFSKRDSRLRDVPKIAAPSGNLRLYGMKYFGIDLEG
jgi:hypothetical protein